MFRLFVLTQTFNVVVRVKTVAFLVFVGHEPLRSSMSKVVLRTHNADVEDGVDHVLRDSPLTHVAIFFLL